MMLFSKKFGVSLVAFLAMCAVAMQPIMANANKAENSSVSKSVVQEATGEQSNDKTFRAANPSVTTDADINVDMLTQQLSESGTPVIKIGSTTQMLKYLANRKSFYMRNLLPIRISSVDNSKLKYFPNIQSQGELGSCTAWASVYYQMSYAVNKALNRNGKLEENTFSPSWVYNMVNDGENIGTYYSDVLAVLSEVGAVPSNMVAIDTTNDWQNIRDLHATKENFLEASKYKVSEFYNIDIKNRDYDTVITCNDDVDLDTIKKALVLGEVLSATTVSDNWQRQEIEPNKWNKDNDPYVGETIVTRCDGYYSGTHRITIVGFNDDIWVDINQNGCVEKGEKGAFKIANSWGTEFDNNGFIWMSYDALNRVSSVPSSENVNLDSYERELGLVDIIGFKVDVKEEDNDVFLNIDMATDNAGEVAVNILAKDRATGEVIGDYNPVPFIYSTTFQNIGVNAFDGTYNENAQGSFYIDLSNVVKGISKDNLENYDFEISISDSYEDASSLKVNNVKLYIKSTDTYIDTALTEKASLNWRSLLIKHGSVNEASLQDAYEPEAVG
ncbi:MAG: hypothetical protein E7262_04810 [Lachnospiraceae bacterium]|nr:hypothetical protein [Lachnospiraceae bacterium]